MHYASTLAAAHLTILTPTPQEWNSITLVLLGSAAAWPALNIPPFPSPTARFVR